MGLDYNWNLQRGSLNEDGGHSTQPVNPQYETLRPTLPTSGLGLLRYLLYQPFSGLIEVLLP